MSAMDQLYLPGINPHSFFDARAYPCIQLVKRYRRCNEYAIRPPPADELTHITHGRGFAHVLPQDLGHYADVVEYFLPLMDDPPEIGPLRQAVPATAAELRAEYYATRNADAARPRTHYYGVDILFSSPDKRHWRVFGHELPLQCCGIDISLFRAQRLFEYLQQELIADYDTGRHMGRQFQSYASHCQDVAGQLFARVGVTGINSLLATLAIFLGDDTAVSAQERLEQVMALPLRFYRELCNLPPFSTPWAAAELLDDFHDILTPLLGNTLARPSAIDAQIDEQFESLARELMNVYPEHAASIVSAASRALSPVQAQHIAVLTPPARSRRIDLSSSPEQASQTGP